MTTTIAMRRVVAVYVALGGLAATAALVIGLAARASATPGDTHKAWVCAYVQKSGGDELVKTGKNPMDVDWAALTGSQVDPQVGDAFSNGNTRSVVVQIDGPDPGLAACPAGTAPATADPTGTAAPSTDSPTGTATEGPTGSPTAPRTSVTVTATGSTGTSEPAIPVSTRTAEPTRPSPTATAAPTRHLHARATPSAIRGSSALAHDRAPTAGATTMPPHPVQSTSTAAVPVTTGPTATPTTTSAVSAATPPASPTTTPAGAAGGSDAPTARTDVIQSVSVGSRIPAGGLVVSGLLLAAAGGLAAFSLRHTTGPAGHSSSSSRRSPALAGQPSRRRRRLELEVGFRRALGLTALGTVVPGAGLLQSHSRAVRWTMAGLVGLGLAIGAYSLLNGGAARVASDATGRSALLLGLGVVFVVGAIGWCGSIVLTAVKSRPAELDRTRTRLLAAFTTGMICLVAMSSFKVAEYAALANEPATSAFTPAPTQPGQDLQAVQGRGR